MSDNDKTIELNRRRVLGGIATIGAASAALGAGTFALFSDEATSEDNQLTAGEIDLELGQSNSIQFQSDDIKPTDTGETFADLDRVDSSDIDTNLSIEVTSVSSSNDVLDDQIDLRLWVGTNGTNDTEFTDGDDILLGSNGDTDTTDPGNGGFDTASNFHEEAWEGVMTEFSGPVTFNVEWEFPDLGEDNNDAMGDDITIDFAFTLEQQSS